jgi:HPt (histidine-containing phosphotransfer) domain-containing protein
MERDADSIEQALNSGDVHQLLKVWEDFNSGETWREVSATGSDQAREAAAHFLAEISEVAALEALRANAKAVELLTGRRWYVMKSAREAGATWAQIGEALGITKQAAHDFYSRKIEEQKKYLSDLHDTAAARAVLDE